jgi:hypothetical protein
MGQGRNNATEEHAKDTEHAATPTDESTAFTSYLKRLSSVVLLQTVIKQRS